MLASDFDDQSVPEQYPPDLELEPVHLDIDLHVDLVEKSFKGTVTTTVVARHDGPSDIELDAVDFLDVEVSDAAGRELSSRYDGRKINIHWVEPFASGEERRVAVAYRVVKPADGLYFSQPSEAYPDQAWYAATDNETERARHWLPCIDLPNVRTTLDFHLRAEFRFTILANGLLLEETPHRDGSKTAHWRLEQRCPSYLTCFAIGDFTRADDGIFDDGEKQIELAYFSNPEHDEATLLRSFGRTGSMMAWMTKKLDMPFPYPKYYQFALPSMWGAMENISLVSWGDFAMLDEAMAAEEGWLIDQINLHEMSHSYFGDAVVVRDFAHAWLKESWATYMEQCWSEDELSQDDGDYVFYDHGRAYFDEADDKYKRPIVTRRFKSSWQMYDRHLYPGGACRLHTLRRELGDQTFWAAVQDYLKRYSGQVVETDDFRHVMEEHSGRSLGKFFDQWFHSKGYPDIKVSFKYDEKQKQGLFEVEQQQVDAEKSIPAFELVTSLGWTIDGETKEMAIKLNEAKHIFIIAMETAPEQVRFDPGNKILHKLTFNPGDPMLRKQLREARDVIGRILAAANRPTSRPSSTPTPANPSGARVSNSPRLCPRRPQKLPSPAWLKSSPRNKMPLFCPTSCRRRPNIVTLGFATPSPAACQATWRPTLDREHSRPWAPSVRTPIGTCCSRAAKKAAIMASPSRAPSAPWPPAASRKRPAFCWTRSTMENSRTASGRPSSGAWEISAKAWKRPSASAC
jgi:aminopeptidase N